MRSVVALALRSGIPVSAWLAEDTSTILTAFELLFEEDRRAAGGSDRVVMSGGG